MTLDVIRKIQEALLFASRNDYQNLLQIKGLGSMVRALVDRLRVENVPGKDNVLEPGMGEALSRLVELFNAFDDRTLPEKRLIVEEGINIMPILEAYSRGQTSPYPARHVSHEIEDIEKSFTILSSPVTDVKGVGPKLQKLLQTKGVETILDLFYFIPRKYEDRRTITTIADAVAGSMVSLIGCVMCSGLKWYGRKKLFEVNIDDGTGILTAKWFKGNERYLRTLFTPGKKVLLTGEIRSWNFSKEIIHPEFETLDEGDRPDGDNLNFGRIVPIYSETEGLSQKVIRRIIKEALNRYARHVINTLPESVRRMYRLYDLAESIREIHFPDGCQDIVAYNESRSNALRTLVFEEFFFFELAMALRRSTALQEPGIIFKQTGKLVEAFHRSLGFKLTPAQIRVNDEIFADMASAYPMNRLLHGDVGCGKTVVAMSAMLRACENGYQCALMVPTEILAEQHLRQITAWAESLNIRTALLTGKLTPSEHRELYDMIAAGEIDIVIGTQALIQEGTSFKSLGLVVIDEQHRFGVMQRASLRQKGQNPDILFMTATPIPRTLAMTVYGDLYVSTIDSLPPGKQEIRTKLFYEKDRSRVYEIISKEVKKKNQVFIVYPLVEESEALDLKDATKMSEKLGADIFPEYRIGLMHGKMKSLEKDQIMRNFAEGKLDILVATTVVEVGIDIPRASLIVIEHAERFGLSQLHQLRGRVGRNDMPSFCILLAGGSKTETASKRLRIMESTNDGFKIAEEDLEIRGPGEFLGTKQSGLPDFRVGNIIRDGKILNDAMMAAFDIVKSDPGLQKPEHAGLQEIILRRWSKKLKYLEAG